MKIKVSIPSIFVSKEEYAKLVDKSITTINNEIKAGLIPVEKKGNHKQAGVSINYFQIIYEATRKSAEKFHDEIHIEISSLKDNEGK